MQYYLVQTAKLHFLSSTPTSSNPPVKQSPAKRSPLPSKGKGKQKRKKIIVNDEPTHNKRE